MISKFTVYNCGNIDNLFIGNPQISFFRSVFKRHTPFSKFWEEIRPKFSDTKNFGNILHYTIKNYGHLLGQMYFEVDLAMSTSAIKTINTGNVTIGTNRINIDAHGFTANQALIYNDSSAISMSPLINNNIYYVIFVDTDNIQLSHTSGSGAIDITNAGNNAQTLTPIDGTVNHIASSLLNTIDLQIAGRTIDKHYGPWLQVYSELNDTKTPTNYPTSTAGGNTTTIEDFYNNDLYMHRHIGNTAQLVSSSTTINKKIYIPLKFWFNNHDGYQLPICCIKDEIKIIVTLETLTNLKGNTNITLALSDIKLKGLFYNISDDEKRIFQTSKHEYLIEQVQTLKSNITSFTRKSATSNLLNTINIKKHFLHPVKYFAWAVNVPGTITTTGVSNQAQGPCYFISLCETSLGGNDGTGSEKANTSMKINGQFLVTEHENSFFTRILPKHYCKGPIPINDRIGFYSFSIEPFKIEPTGTLNFSSIRNSEFIINIANNNMATLSATTVTKYLYLFAVNYNILRIQDGQAGIKYIN